MTRLAWLLCVAMLLASAACDTVSAPSASTGLLAGAVIVGAVALAGGGR